MEMKSILVDHFHSLWPTCSIVSLQQLENCEAKVRAQLKINQNNYSTIEYELILRFSRGNTVLATSFKLKICTEKVNFGCKGIERVRLENIAGKNLSTTAHLSSSPPNPFKATFNRKFVHWTCMD